MRSLRDGLCLTCACLLLTCILAVPAHGAVAVVIDSEGDNPADFPNLQVQYGNVLFGQHVSTVFGLDPTTLTSLPDADRFPNDFHDLLAKNEFLTHADTIRKARGMLLSFCDFNNPDPTQPNDIIRIQFDVPLVDGQGNPLGGRGQRWVHVQFGPNAANQNPPNPAGPNPNDPPEDQADDDPMAGGSGGGHLSPPSTPLRAWAAFIRGFEQMPGESEDDFRQRVKDAIKEAKRHSSKSSIMRYLKLVDDSKMDDPRLNFIAELQNDGGVRSVPVELAFIVEKGTFSRVARWIDKLTVAVTNDATLLPLDPNNQPPGELLLGTAPVDLGGGGGGGGGGTPTIGIGVGDVLVEAASVVSAGFGATVFQGGLDVTFQVDSGLVLDGDGSVNFLEIRPHAFDPPGVTHVIPYKQLVDMSAKELAEELAFMVNAWPLAGSFRYIAVQDGNRVSIRRKDGEPIQGAHLLHAVETKLVFEDLVISPFEGKEVPPPEPGIRRMDQGFTIP